MLTVIADCDKKRCRRYKFISTSSITPEYPATKNLLKKMGWIFTDTSLFCSYKCQEDYRLQCEHNQVVKKDGYSECSDCGEIWEGK